MTEIVILYDYIGSSWNFCRASTYLQFEAKVSVFIVNIFNKEKSSNEWRLKCGPKVSRACHDVIIEIKDSISVVLTSNGAAFVLNIVVMVIIICSVLRHMRIPYKVAFLLEYTVTTQKLMPGIQTWWTCVVRKHVHLSDRLEAKMISTSACS
jgi:hypothetical protein